MSEQYLIGDTVKLTCEFINKEDGVTPVDPTSITLKIYDENRVQIGSTVTITSSNKISTGLYYYYLTIPNNPPHISTEWIGIKDSITYRINPRINIVWDESDINELPTITLTVATNTYISLEDANTYFTTKLNSNIWDSSNDTDKSKALIQATNNIDMLLFQGVKRIPTQALQFPRYFSYYKLNTDMFITELDIPVEVEKACCEEAIALLTNIVSPNQRYELQRQGVKSVSFGDASESYTAGLNNTLISTTAKQLLSPYIANSVPVLRRRI